MLATAKWRLPELIDSGVQFVASKMASMIDSGPVVLRHDICQLVPAETCGFGSWKVLPDKLKVQCSGANNRGLRPD